MANLFERQELLIGPEGTEKLKNKRVAILGLGGVGAAALEGVVRTGVGHLLFIDNDTVDPTNLNRQLLATTNTIGRKKTEVARERALSIHPAIDVTTSDIFYNKEHNDILRNFAPDFLIDCIDSVTSKLDFMEFVFQNNLPAVSCLGTGNRLSPFHFTYGTIEDTAGSGDPLGRVLRREIKKRNVTGSKVIYSTVKPNSKSIAESDTTRHPPGSISFTPPVAGFLAASVCINTLLENPIK